MFSTKLRGVKTQQWTSTYAPRAASRVLSTAYARSWTWRSSDRGVTVSHAIWSSRRRAIRWCSATCSGVGTVRFARWAPIRSEGRVRGLAASNVVRLSGSARASIRAGSQDLGDVREPSDEVGHVLGDMGGDHVAVSATDDVDKR